MPAHQLNAHLAHGDGLAPDSVQTDAHCLVPQPPPEPVSVAAMTEEDGVARFVIPKTNIRVVATILDESGAPLPGMTTDLFAAGSNYLMVAHDATNSPRYAPATAVGSLLDARPGSAPTLTPFFNLGLPPPPLCSERVSNGTPAQSNGCSTPLYQYYSLMVPFMGPLPFQLACDSHDRCYDTCNKAKVDCDSEFLGSLMQACLSALNPVACVPVATQFYSAVSLVGGGHYVDAQKIVCDCCDPGEVSCSNQCIDLQGDPDNCGTCGNACSAGLCVAGQCTGECPSGTGLCGGQCVATTCQPDKVWEPSLCRCVPCPSGVPNQCGAGIPFTLSGGSSPADTIHVDDDFYITLNGVEVYADRSGRDEWCGAGGQAISFGNCPAHSPITFNGTSGDVVRIVGIDFGGHRGFSSIYLHGDGAVRQVTSFVSDRGGAGAFVDVSYTIP